MPSHNTTKSFVRKWNNQDIFYDVNVLPIPNLKFKYVFPFGSNRVLLKRQEEHKVSVSTFLLGDLIVFPVYCILSKTHKKYHLRCLSSVSIKMKNTRTYIRTTEKLKVLTCCFQYSGRHKYKLSNEIQS